jgi:phosphoenolpyruvate carboxylase
VEQEIRLARALSAHFHLANLGQHVRQTELLAEAAGRHPGPLQQVLDRVRRATPPREVVDGVLRRLELRPVYTAHPTEASRRSVLAKLARSAALLRERCRTFVANVEMTLHKTDLRIAGHYVESLVDPSLHHLFGVITDEYERTCAEVLRLTGEARLLDREPVLQQAFEARRPSLDPLCYLQVRLLRRASLDGEPDPLLRRALLLTVNGIAAGIQNTG